MIRIDKQESIVITVTTKARQRQPPVQQLLYRRKTFPLRTAGLTLLMVAALSFVLPLSQTWIRKNDTDLVVVRRVDVTQPPPPPSEQEAETKSAESSMKGALKLESMVAAIEFDAIVTGSAPDLLEVMKVRVKLGDRHVTSNSTFGILGVDFGLDGLDSLPRLVNRPPLDTRAMVKLGIRTIYAEVLVKWRKDGYLDFIYIEKISVEGFDELIRGAVSNMRYTKPTVNGVPEERFARLPLTIRSTILSEAE